MGDGGQRGDRAKGGGIDKQAGATVGMRGRQSPTDVGEGGRGSLCTFFAPITFGEPLSSIAPTLGGAPWGNWRVRRAATQVECGLGPWAPLGVGFEEDPKGEKPYRGFVGGEIHGADQGRRKIIETREGAKRGPLSKINGTEWSNLVSLEGRGWWGRTLGTRGRTPRVRRS